MVDLYSKDPNVLIDKYYSYLKLYNEIDNEEVKYSMVEFLTLLRNSINKMKLIPIKEEKTLFTKNIVDKYNNIMHSCYVEILNNFVENKEYNYKLFSGILDNMETLFRDKEGYYTKEEEISSNDFYAILHDFMKSLSLEDLFYEIVRNKKIFSYKYRKKNGMAGFAMYNPFENNSDIFIKNFKYNINILRYVAHELGHCYDYKSLEKEPFNKINKYMGKSVYIETKSRIFERLMLRYLYKNNIELNATIDNTRDFHLINHDFLVESVIFSLFDDELLNNDEIVIDPKELINRLDTKGKFNKEALEIFIKNLINFDLKESLVYTYGDIISSIGADIVENEGLDNEMIRDIDKIKFGNFDINFMEKYNINKDTYTKSLIKEMKY